MAVLSLTFEDTPEDEEYNQSGDDRHGNRDLQILPIPTLDKTGKSAPGDQGDSPDPGKAWQRKMWITYLDSRPNTTGLAPALLAMSAKAYSGRGEHNVRLGIEKINLPSLNARCVSCCTQNRETTSRRIQTKTMKDHTYRKGIRQLARL